MSRLLRHFGALAAGTIVVASVAENSPLQHPARLPGVISLDKREVNSCEVTKCNRAQR